MHLAAQCGHEKIVHLLVQAGADKDARGEWVPFLGSLRGITNFAGELDQADSSLQLRNHGREIWEGLREEHRKFKEHMERGIREEEERMRQAEQARARRWYYPRYEPTEKAIVS